MHPSMRHNRRGYLSHLPPLPLPFPLVFPPSRLRVSVAGIHRPVVLGDARPEQPDEHDRHEGEEGLKEGAVDLARGAVADVRADDKVKHLPRREGDRGDEQVQHGAGLAEDAQDEDGLEDKVQHDGQQREQQVQDVEGDVAVRVVFARGPVAGEGEAGVEGDVADADEDGEGGAAEQAERERGAVVDQLEADDAVEEEDPAGGGDGADVDGAECLERS